MRRGRAFLLKSVFACQTNRTLPHARPPNHCRRLAIPATSEELWRQHSATLGFFLTKPSMIVQGRIFVSRANKMLLSRATCCSTSISTALASTIFVSVGRRGKVTLGSLSRLSVSTPVL